MTNINKDLELDLYHLDEAYLDLPKLTERWNSSAVEAEIASMNAKNDLDSCRSQLELDVRENPANHGLSKVTEGAVASVINEHPDVKRLTTEYYEFLIEQKRIKSKCATISIVGKSLDLLSEIYKSGYFSNKPIWAMASTIIQEKETTKLNTDQNRTKLKSAKK